MSDPFAAIRAELVAHPDQASMRALGYAPVYTAGPTARIAVIGQAPGRIAQASGVPWDDASGARLLDWMGVTGEQFRDPARFAILPMDFYYPGRGTGGDLPPRRGFAARWHPPLFALMPEVRLKLLIGSYAQAYYLARERRGTLTETVRAYADYLPEFLPIVHPSPLNFRWLAKNPWFEADVVPALREAVATALGPAGHPAS
jgi:uracil-DNA glycosylase